MDEAVRLNAVDQARLAGWLQDAVGEVLVAVDDIDGALKVKVDGRWSPPIGVLKSTAAPVVDSARTVADDLAQEATVLRPAWWGSRQDDRPDPAEYRGADQ